MRTLLLTLLILGTSPSLWAQSLTHVFPQFADGRLPDGTSYRSTIAILPWFDTEAPRCTLSLRGMTANLESGLSGSDFVISIPAGGYFAGRSTGSQAYQGGYATLTCNTNVFATVLYALHASNGVKISEATVFSANEFSEARLIADHRDGSRLGLAIANNTDVQHTYTVSLVSNGQTRSTTLTIPAGRTVARFLDEMVNVTAGSVGIVRITATDSSNFSAIGLRFTGGVFTTVPAS